MEPTSQAAKQATGDGMKEIEVQDYLSAAGDASTRSRSVAIVLAVASVIVFAALINSLQHQWMLERLQALSDPQNPYVAKKIGPYPEPSKFKTPAALQAAKENFYERYKLFYGAVAKTYVENALFTRAPLLGISVDANDLGILGGAAFIVILIMYSYSLRREEQNLKIARKQAEHFDQICEFYYVLAMRQVFTIPPSDASAPRRLVVWGPKLICALPLTVHLSVTIHDIVTTNIGALISDTHNLILIVVEVVALVFLVELTRSAITTHNRLDEIWKAWWGDVRKAEQAA
ncbi:MAG TPA: hypothetical protein VHG32_16975 [Thermoanaerobaculia bacterium]|jgi:hypothetical protein|nr:hypothetical protein [Thermoanaerobaculia bacterium]